MTWTNEEAERVKAVEIKQEDLFRVVAAMDAKLDELLALKHKGLGAFWLASILIGAIFTGIMAFATNIFRI